MKFRLGIMAVAALGMATAARAQAPATTYTIQISDQEIEGIISAGSMCLEKVPYACAEVMLHIRNRLNAARQQKAPPPEKKNE